MFTSTICHNKILNSADKETLRRCDFLNKGQYCMSETEDRIQWDSETVRPGIEWVGVSHQGEEP